ncbi:hypothetical protein BDD12DRAFT_823497 [Trichophaea hybrida]|nr:hypothetical protein BDD12DRAFT_823497 [Trichophaea hybrida]
MSPPIRIGFVGLSSRQPPAWSTYTHVPYLLSPSGLSKYRIPALEAGKMAFVEWPLGANLSEAEELARIAEEKGVRTVVGLQGGLIRLLIRYVGLWRRGGSGMYGGERGGGAEIFFGKGIRGEFGGGGGIGLMGRIVIDMVQRTLGNITIFQSLLANQRKTVDLTSSSGEVVEASVLKDTADHISLHGILSSGAVLSLFVRGGKQFDPKAPTITWSIYGSKGEIEVTSPNISLQMSVDVKVRVKVGDGEPEIVEVDDQGKKGPAANVERLYEAFYNGDERMATFRDAVENHKFLEELYDGRLGEPVVFAKRGL